MSPPPPAPSQEVALRYVLEDGKLNVCLRNLSEWRDFHRKRRDEVGQPHHESPLVRTALRILSP